METTTEKEETKRWDEWPGPGDPPPSWWATNPETNERTKVYRSYEDYCND